MTSFPTNLDALTNPSASDSLDTAGVVHHTQHSDVNDAVEALEAKVGKDGSAVTTSLDYKVTQNTANISTNTASIATSASNISTLQTNVGTLATEITTPAEGDTIIYNVSAGKFKNQVILDTTAPGSSAEGDSASAGTSTKAAHVDHRHGRESFATPGIVLGTAAAAGAATTPIRSDSTIVAFDATAPSTQAFSDAAATGSAAVASRRDHKHGMPASPSASFATNALVLGTTAAAGAASTVLRSDDTIAAFDATVPVTQAFSDAAATGSAAVAARRDHKHGMMASPSASAFSLVVDESGASFANWTGVSGTWSSDGTVIKQTDTAASFRTAKFTTSEPNAIMVCQAEIKIVTAGGMAGLLVSDGTAAGWGARIEDTADVIKIEKVANSATSSGSVTINTGTFYTVKLVMVGAVINAYVDGVFKTSGDAGTSQECTKFCLYSYNTEAHFKNIKVYYLTLPI